MENTTTPHPAKRLAVVTMGVKLGDETRGYTRFRKLSEMLVEAGFEIDLITSSFQHWDKAPRDTSDPAYRRHPFNVVFIDEPGYRKNLDLARILSHRKAARNLTSYLRENAGAYAAVYAEIPPNDVARAAAEYAAEQGIPFVADVNDLWPEAMRMVVDVPVLSDAAFYPFSRDARRVYRSCAACVGTSDEYAARPLRDRVDPCETLTVYVGNDLAAFDAGVAAHRSEVEKPKGEFWAVYAGMLGASYDLATLVQAAALVDERQAETADTPRLRVKILGDGPDRAALEALAAQLRAPVDFVGYAPYETMAAWLAASDVTVNSLVAAAPQSIVTKIGDYLASGRPMINTGSSPEFRAKVERDGFGVNVEAEDAAVLAGALEALRDDPAACAAMGRAGRAVAEREFDQTVSYRAIVDLLARLVGADPKRPAAPADAPRNAPS
ncbi:glycosyltransferase family 4 protein [Xiamenia xianingshaonis]|uniref:glycosyltransferase family 4 protein n=1 Tax=Xiamenia xianingshaonis TaxID=2682776 RepID=UPI0021BD3D1D|nr:glycosyltransferase family 4 protein [Xiamenia xianingshaonis]